MSLKVDNLSLLASRAPLRTGPAPDTVRTRDTGFSDRLDKALGIGDASSVPPAAGARELAESLSLQMLQSSLTLGGDSASGSAGIASPAPYSDAAALLQSYRANLAQGGDSTAPAARGASQLHELAESTPGAAVVSPAGPSGDGSWLDPIIASASRKYGVDAGLIRAVIKAESNFNPRAVSSAGARGLMQLMPATARSLGVTDSFDPEQNVQAGTRFLKDLLQRYNGDLDSALAAYNWGPGNVDRRPGRLPRETSEYLARVKQLYASYSG